MFSFLLKITFSSLIPGGALIVQKRYKSALLVPIFGLIWVLLFSITRLVVTPLGFLIMLAGLLVIHFGTFFFARVSKMDSIQSKCNWFSFSVFSLFLVGINLAIAIISHIHKPYLYGFDFYLINSGSMEPSVKVNDVVLVDTWSYNKRKIKIGDIIIFNQRDRILPAIKRVAPFPNYIDSIEPNTIFVIGDNKWKSYDSRYHGAIKNEEVFGQAKIILFSMNPYIQKNYKFRLLIQL